MAKLSLRRVFKVYAEYQAVRGIDLEIADNEFVVLVGPSGCGKSTTLRMIAGLEHISGGEIQIGDRVVNKLGPGERDIAMVFQNYALYPHMSVSENIGFCLEQQRMKKDEIDKRVRLAAKTLHIEELLDRKPGQLSGGQRQRVAMGRAIVRNPKVFLFDEPLSNLDAQLRVQMRTEIKRLHQQFPTTTVYVTHDQTEAMTMADRVVVMNKGLIEQAGPPQELYHAPASAFVATFIGSPAMNMLPGTIATDAMGHAVVLRAGPKLPIAPAIAERFSLKNGQAVHVGLRPEAITGRDNRPETVPLDVRLDLVEPLGVETLIYFPLGETMVCGRLDDKAKPMAGETMAIGIDTDRLHLFDAGTGLSLRKSRA
jgi:multiple sugar transport system ATP-binding protein